MDDGSVGTAEEAVSEGGSRRFWPFPLAVGVALLLAWFAPADWSSGPGEIEIRYLDTVIASVPVEFGSRESIAETIETELASVEMAVPGGLEVDEPIEIEVRAYSPGRVVRAGDLEVSIIGRSGDAEIVPTFDADDGWIGAKRRPVDGAVVVLAVLGAAMVLWVTEVVPLFVTSLAIPVVLAATEIGPAAQTLAPFFDPIIVLFFGGFLMAEAMRRAGLDRLVAVTIVDLAGSGPVRLYSALVCLAAFLSMWMSNTAAVAVLIPVALAVTDPLDSPAYRRVVVLGIAYAATIGGIGSAIGTPANLLAISFTEKFTGREISFAEWFRFGLPMVVVFLPIMATYLWVVGGAEPPLERFRHTAAIAREERRSAGPLTRAQVDVMAVFGGVMVLWLTQSWHGLNTGIVALGGAVVLFTIGRIETEDLSRVSWPTLLTFGGGLTLGTFMVTTGTSDWLVSRVGGLGGWPELLAIGAMAVLALGLTTVASNTAAAATLIPLAMPAAGIVGVEPVLLVAVVAIATSVDFALVIGTPPTMLAYSTHLFTVPEILRKGAILDVIGIAMLVFVVVPFWRLIGLV